MTMQSKHVIALAISFLLIGVGIGYGVTLVTQPVSFTIGTTPQPGLQLSDTNIFYGQVQPGSINILAFTLTNVGNVDLVLNYQCLTSTGVVCGPLSAVPGTADYSVIVRTGPGAELVNYSLGVGLSVGVETVLSVSPTIAPGSYTSTITYLT